MQAIQGATGFSFAASSSCTLCNGRYFDTICYILAPEIHYLKLRLRVS